MAGLQATQDQIFQALRRKLSLGYQVNTMDRYLAMEVWTRLLSANKRFDHEVPPCRKLQVNMSGCALEDGKIFANRQIGELGRLTSLKITGHLTPPCLPYLRRLTRLEHMNFALSDTFWEPISLPLASTFLTSLVVSGGKATAV